MWIETNRLIIRSVQRGDEIIFSDMAQDGSLSQVSESEIIATILDANAPSWKIAEKSGFKLIEKKMYKDIDDEKEELYRFYVIRGHEGK